MVLNLVDVFPTWRDGDGNPFAGRISCYDGVQTTQFKSIYTDYSKTTLSSNPVTLGTDGKTPTQIFLGYGTYFIKVEKYLGSDYQEMNQYWNDSSYWEVQETFTIDGGTAPQVLSDVRITVDTISDLRTVDVTKYSTVAVLGYYAKGDTDVRTYVWVSGITNPDDYGKYIQSSVSSDGRWVLCCSENLDATWYGVFPSVSGNDLTSRMTALASYSANCYQIILKKGVYYLNSCAITFPCKVMFEGKFSSLTNQTPVVTINELITNQDSVFEDANATIFVRKGTIKTSWFSSDNWQYINDGNTVVINSSKTFNYKRTYSQVTFIIENSLLYSFSGTVTFDYCIFYGIQIFSDPSLINDSGALFVFSNCSIRTSQLGSGINLKVISDSPTSTFIIDCDVANNSSITNEITNCTYEKGSITSSVVVKIDILPKDGCLHGPIIVSSVSEARFYDSVNSALLTLQKVVLNGAYALTDYEYAGTVEVQGGSLTGGTLSATTIIADGTTFIGKGSTITLTNCNFTLSGVYPSDAVTPPSITATDSFISFSSGNLNALTAYRCEFVGSVTAIRCINPVVTDCVFNLSLFAYNSSVTMKASIVDCVFNDPAVIKLTISGSTDVVCNSVIISGNKFVSSSGGDQLLAIQGTGDSGFASSGHSYSIISNSGSGRYLVQNTKGSAVIELATLVVATDAAIPATSSTPTAIVRGPEHWHNDTVDTYFYAGGLSGIDFHNYVPFIGEIPTLLLKQTYQPTRDVALATTPYVPAPTGYSGKAELIPEGIYKDLINFGTIMLSWNSAYSTYTASYGTDSSESASGWKEILGYSTIKTQLEWEIV